MVSTRQAFTRSELYDLVWAEPMSKLGPRIGVPEVTIVRACERADVPLPGWGYWARRYHNKTGRVPSLPKRALGQNDMVVVGSGSEPRINLHKRKIEPPKFDAPIDEMRSRMAAKIERISFRANDENTELQRYAAKDERRKKKVEGNPLYEEYPGLATLWGPLFDTPFERRRMTLLSRLSAVARRLGGDLVIRGELARDLTFRAYDTPVTLTVDDANGPRGERSEPKERGSMHVAIKAGSHTHKQWDDDATGKIEKRLPEIVLEIFVRGEQLHRKYCLERFEFEVKEQARLRLEMKQSRGEKLERLRREAKQRTKRRIERLLLEGKGTG